MIWIMPPYNGSGIPVRRAEDVDGVIRQVAAMTFRRGRIVVEWRDEGEQYGATRLQFALDGDRAGLVYTDADGGEWVPADSERGDLAASDGHMAVMYPSTVPAEAAYAAVVGYYDAVGGRPRGEWIELWRLDGDEVLAEEHGATLTPEPEDFDVYGGRF